MDSSASDNGTATNPLKLLEFFMLIGKLKETKRTGWLLRDINPCESVADHMYRMAIMAFLIGRKENSELDRDRCIKMAVVHDMAESIVGDITPFCGVSKEEKHRREAEAMEKIGSLVDEETRRELLDLYQEYEKQQTPEAKAVKDLDRFDMVLQAFEYEKRSQNAVRLQCFFDNTKGKFTSPEVREWVDALNNMRQQESGQKLTNESVQDGDR